MKKLWAPWRLESIVQEKKQQDKAGTCIFCDIAQGEPNVENLVLKKGKFVYVVMNKYPYTNGHLMIIPYRHLDDYSDLNDDEIQEMTQFKQLSLSILKKVYNPQGFNIGMNLGEAAGAGIAHHLHEHIVPRWSGDHNFMPVLADVRVMLEHVQKTYERLMEHF